MATRSRTPARTMFRTPLLRCLADAGKRLRQGERQNHRETAHTALMGIRKALAGLGLSLTQREIFLGIAATELLEAYLVSMERIAVKRRVN